jgi:CDP-6-deoxy-D-xylo-4-hexulose-3-dehydrase
MKNTMYSGLAVDSVDSNDADIRTINEHIIKYCQAKHNFDFCSSDPAVRLHEPTFSAPEIIAALEVLLSTKVTMGPAVKGFEERFSKLHEFGHGVSSNSGSSANLLAVAALTNIETQNHLSPGDEVIVPALSWSTNHAGSCLWKSL